MELSLQLAILTDIRRSKPPREAESKLRASGSFEMSAFSGSYLSKTLCATPVLTRVVNETSWRWRRLTASLFNPYRPELHYMRGPGPKWREKHGRSPS